MASTSITLLTFTFSSLLSCRSLEILVQAFAKADLNGRHLVSVSTKVCFMALLNHVLLVWFAM